MQDFLNVVATDFNGIIGKIDTMQDNMHKIKLESTVAQKELNSFKRKIKKKNAFANVELNEKVTQDLTGVIDTVSMQHYK